MEEVIRMPGKNEIYKQLQTLLLVAFGAVYFWLDGPWLFAPRPATEIIGAILSAGGVLLIVSAVITLRRVVQVEPAPRADGELVRRGVYSCLRHPIYTAIIVIVIGLLLRKPTVLNGVAAAAVITFLAIKVRFEEKLLRERYPEYAAYARRTWGLIPWPESSIPADQK
jgi:protein-S-isoprenylcysteine O-methyltransferase Ste14